MSIIEALFFLGATCVLSFLGTRYLVSHPHALDAPNHRSSHTEITPTGGGTAIVIIFLLGLWVALFMTSLSIWTIGILACATLVMALTGWWDDQSHIAPKVRLLIQLICVLVTFAVVVEAVPVLRILDWQCDSVWLLVLIIPAFLWWINLFNFMDGIDGIASVEALCILVPAGLWLLIQGEQNWSFLIWVLSGAVLGFLLINWPPAKIFMGDVGSASLGLLIGAFALSTSALGYIELWSWLILAAVFISDATVVLVRRWGRGIVLSEAHRSHAYQILSRRWQSHRKVTLLVLAVNLIWLMPIAWLAQLQPGFGVFYMLLAYLPLVVLVWKLGAGSEVAASVIANKVKQAS